MNCATDPRHKQGKLQVIQFQAQLGPLQCIKRLLICSQYYKNCNRDLTVYHQCYLRTGHLLEALYFNLAASGNSLGSYHDLLAVGYCGYRTQIIRATEPLTIVQQKHNYFSSKVNKQRNFKLRYYGYYQRPDVTLKKT